MEHTPFHRDHFPSLLYTSFTSHIKMKTALTFTAVLATIVLLAVTAESESQNGEVNEREALAKSLMARQSRIKRQWGYPYKGYYGGGNNYYGGGGYGGGGQQYGGGEKTVIIKKKIIIRPGYDGYGGGRTVIIKKKIIRPGYGGYGK